MEDEDGWWMPDPGVHANHEHRAYRNRSAQRAETAPTGAHGTRSALAGCDPHRAACRPDLLLQLEQPCGRRLGRRGDAGPLTPGLTGVDLAGDNNIIVQVGARQSIVVHADSNLLRRVTTRVRSGRLVIGNTPGNLSAKSPIDAVTEGRFHVWAISTVDDALQLLTGIPAGEPGPDGTYPEASLHGRVHARITAFAALARAFGQPARPEPTPELTHRRRRQRPLARPARVAPTAH
jgi:hypothetical protein